jgi:hypothetical protein
VPESYGRPRKATTTSPKRHRIFHNSKREQQQPAV